MTYSDIKQKAAGKAAQCCEALTSTALKVKQLPSDDRILVSSRASRNPSRQSKRPTACVPRHGLKYLPSVRRLMCRVLDIFRVCPALTVLGEQILGIPNSGLIGLRHLKELNSAYSLRAWLHTAVKTHTLSNGGIGGAFVPSFIHLLYRVRYE